jgi:hypothetical protein
MRKFIYCLVILAFAFVLPDVTQAQTKGSLSGVVTDSAGAVVPGASVTVKNNETNVVRTATTSDNGVFQLSDVDPGTYTVTVENAGFKRAVATNVVVNTTLPSQISIALETGQVSETVTVTGAQEVINTTSPSLTNVISTKQIVDLPLPDRNPLGLAALQAGIAVIGTDTRGSSVAGLRQTATNVTQDGINAMDNFVKTSSFFAINSPSLNATEEFSITTGTTSSENGRGVAQVNMVTRSGSNQFHGGGFLQIINDAYNTNTWFNNYNGIAKPVLRQHYWGGDIGGPVYFPAFGEGKPEIWNGHDTAFFYFSFERFVQNRAAVRNRNGVLTQSARNGIFQFNNGGLQSFDLLGATSPVPLHALNPIMTAYLAKIPLPNNFNCSNSDGLNIGCYTFNAPENTFTNKYVARYDHQLVKHSPVGTHKLEFVFSRADTQTHPDVFTNGLEAPFPGGVDGFQGGNRNLVTGALVSQFGPNWTNVFRYGRQWAPVNFARDTDPTAPFIVLPSALVTYDNTFMPQPRNTTVNQFTDTVSWVKGNHLWKFGGDFQKVFVLSDNSAGINQTINLGTNAANNNNLSLGTFGLAVSTANNAIVANASTVYNTIAGMLGSASQTVNVTSPTSGFIPGATRERTFQEQDLALFAQDQWRMWSNFTLNAGVRWDWMGVPTVPNGLSIQPNYKDLFGVSGFGNLFHPTAAPGVPPGIATQQFVSGTTGIPLFKNDWNNFAPYFGFAYSPDFKKGVLHVIFGGTGQSSIRAGYSISYLHDGLTTISNALGTGTTNPGLIQTSTNSPLSCANPASCTPGPNLLGQLGAGGVPMVFAPFAIPITDRQNIINSSSNGIWAVDPNLRSPYAEQWNIGYEREIGKDTAFEIRYVGNRGVKLWRAVDFNEVNIFENGFLQEFIRAQGNLAANEAAFAAGDVTRRFCPGFVVVATNVCQTSATNTTLVARIPRFDYFGAGTGTVPLTILNAFFASQQTVGMTSAFASSGFVTNLNTNNVGAMASTLAFNTAYRTNRECVPGPTNPACIGVAQNFFVANPNAAFARGLSNDAFSNFNSLEIEVRRRFSAGLQFQADFTWGKALGNSTDAQGNNQSDLTSWTTLRNKDLNYLRSTQDQTARFVTNALYELPFGKGKPFGSDMNSWLDRLVGHWSVGGIWTWSTGSPFYVSSGRTTFNNGTANNGAQLVGITFDEFKKHVGVYNTPGGIFYIDPALLDITYTASGKVASSKLKAGLMTAPAPGTLGNFPVNSLNTPQYFNIDMSFIKRIPITESVRVELKATAINFLNHPNWIYATQNFDATNFGLITTQRDTGRQMNFQVQVKF